MDSDALVSDTPVCDDFYMNCKAQVCDQLKIKPGTYWAALVLIVVVGIVMLFYLFYKANLAAIDKSQRNLLELSGPSVYQNRHKDGKDKKPVTPRWHLITFILVILIFIFVIGLITIFFIRGNYQVSIFISVIFLILAFICGGC